MWGGNFEAKVGPSSGTCDKIRTNDKFDFIADFVIDPQDGGLAEEGSSWSVMEADDGFMDGVDPETYSPFTLARINNEIWVGIPEE